MTIENGSPRMMIDALALHRFRFTLEAVGSLSLPAFPGNEFHGGLGMMLARDAPEVFRVLYDEQDGSRPRPYMLHVPVFERDLSDGEPFYVDLTLFGLASAIFYACFDALAQLGKMGIGRERGRFAIRAVDAVKPDGQTPVFSREEGHGLFWDAATQLGELLVPPAAAPASACSVDFFTPLRLKQNNQLVRTPPALELLLQRILSRASQLAGAPLPAWREQVLDVASQARVASHDMCWHEWNRYSSRQQKVMPFGGLMGTVRYEGDNLQALLPYLRLAEWLHVGNKTTFGLGACRVTAG